jgi:threonine dehydratase
MPHTPLSLANIYQARQRIAPIIYKTPVLESAPLSQITGKRIYLKLENNQQTTSFKIRGAANKLLSLSQDEREKGVITVSSGNHGKAVAFVAQKLGIPAVIGLSEHVPENKVRDIQGYGAETLIAGETWDETVAQTEKVQKARGLTYIEAFDDPDIIAGQGTLMLEVLERYPWIDTVLVPLSGGGLAGGVALAAKSINPDIRVVGVSQTGGPSMYLSIRAGAPVEVPEPPTLADALLGGIGQINRYTLDLCSRLLDDSILVSEDEIAEAIAFLLDRHQQAVEGAGAVGVAALLHQHAEIGEHTLIVISGGSIKPATLLKVMEKYLNGE